MRRDVDRKVSDARVASELRSLGVAVAPLPPAHDEPPPGLFAGGDPPMSEATGQKILGALLRIERRLVERTSIRLGQPVIDVAAESGVEGH
jgi:hypothetical protein